MVLKRLEAQLATPRQSQEAAEVVDFLSQTQWISVWILLSPLCKTVLKQTNKQKCIFWRSSRDLQLCYETEWLLVPCLQLWGGTSTVLTQQRASSDLGTLPPLQRTTEIAKETNNTAQTIAAGTACSFASSGTVWTLILISRHIF